VRGRCRFEGKKIIFFFEPLPPFQEGIRLGPAAFLQSAGWLSPLTSFITVRNRLNVSVCVAFQTPLPVARTLVIYGKPQLRPNNIPRDDAFCSEKTKNPRLKESLSAGAARQNVFMHPPGFACNQQKYYGIPVVYFVTTSK